MNKQNASGLTHTIDVLVDLLNITEEDSRSPKQDKLIQQIRSKAPLNTDEGAKALGKAIEYGFAEVAFTLIEAEVNVNHDGLAPLFKVLMAAKLTSHNKLNLTKELIKKGVNVDAKNQDNMTALHIAVNNKLKSITYALIEAGANTRMQNNRGQTPLHLALNCKDNFILHEEVPGDLNSDIKSKFQSVDPEHVSIAADLISAGAPFSSIPDFTGRSPFDQIDDGALSIFNDIVALIKQKISDKKTDEKKEELIEYRTKVEMEAQRRKDVKAEVDKIKTQLECGALQQKDIVGSGATGTLYFCVTNYTASPVALKTITKVNAIKKVSDELAIMRTIQHPNIARCYRSEFDKDTVTAKIWMEYIQGGTLLKLAQRLDQRDEDGTKYLNEDLCKHYIRQILYALAYLHDKRIAHGDLKPDNVMIDNKRVKLIDFGSACHFKKYVYAEEDVGTPHYMSPECFDKERMPSANANEMVNIRHFAARDIWALGILLLVILNHGELPYPGIHDINELSIHISTLQESPTIPSNLCISDECKSFIRKCLTVDVCNRPSTEELFQDEWLCILPADTPVSNSNERISNCLQTIQDINNFETASITNASSADSPFVLLPPPEEDGFFICPQLTIDVPKGMMES